MHKLLVDLASLKSEIDRLDIGKLETTPIDISKLSDVVKNEVQRLYLVNQLKWLMLSRSVMSAI